MPPHGTTPAVVIANKSKIDPLWYDPLPYLVNMFTALLKDLFYFHLKAVNI